MTTLVLILGLLALIFGMLISGEAATPERNTQQFPIEELIKKITALQKEEDDTRIALEHAFKTAVALGVSLGSLLTMMVAISPLKEYLESEQIYIYSTPFNIILTGIITILAASRLFLSWEYGFANWRIRRIRAKLDELVWKRDLWRMAESHGIKEEAG